MEKISNPVQPIQNFRDFLFAELGLGRGLLTEETLGKGQAVLEEMAQFGIKNSLVNVLVDRRLLDRETVREIMTEFAEIEATAPCCRSRIHLGELTKEGRSKCSSCGTVISFELRDEVSKVPGRLGDDLESSLKASVVVVGDARPDPGGGHEAIPALKAPPGGVAEPSPRRKRRRAKAVDTHRQPARRDRKKRGSNDSTDREAHSRLARVADAYHWTIFPVNDAREEVQKYRLETLIHHGSHGPNYLARAQSGAERVAVKLLGQVNELVDRPLTALRERLSLWSSIPCRPGNPWHELVEEGAWIYVARPYLGDGHVALSEWKSSRAEDRLLVLKKITEQLAEVHKAGQLHGNLKPSNIFLRVAEQRLEVSLVDPALDLLTPRANELERWKHQVEAPHHRCPEEIRGEAPTTASDVYALGWIFFQVLTGKPPFGDSRPHEVLRRHTEGPCPQFPESAGSWKQLVEWMTAVDPHERASDACAVLVALEQVIAKKTPRLGKVTPRTPAQRLGTVDRRELRAPSSGAAGSGRAAAILHRLVGPVLLLVTCAWVAHAGLRWQEARTAMAAPDRNTTLYHQTAHAAFERAREEARRDPERGRAIWNRFLGTFSDTPLEGAAKAERRNFPK